MSSFTGVGGPTEFLRWVRPTTRRVANPKSKNAQKIISIRILRTVRIQKLGLPVPADEDRRQAEGRQAGQRQTGFWPTERLLVNFQLTDLLIYCC
jgi:hypothetical protein